VSAINHALSGYHVNEFEDFNVEFLSRVRDYWTFQILALSLGIVLMPFICFKGCGTKAQAFILFLLSLILTVGTVLESIAYMLLSNYFGRDFSIDLRDELKSLRGCAGHIFELALS